MNRIGKTQKMMKNVYVLVIDSGSMGTPEDISTVVSSSIESLIDYVINEELPELGYSSEEIEEMGVELSLSEDLYWVDPEGAKYIINESKMI
jgi:hypothetical protein